jgi:hypothetical protein
MQNSYKLVEILFAQGNPSNEESSAMRSIRMTNGDIFRGVLGETLKDVIEKSCKSQAPSYLSKYEHNARLIITNLIVAAFQWEWLGLGTRVSKGSYLDSLGLSRRRIESIVSALIETGYALKGRGGYLYHGNPSKSRSTQYYPTEKLLRLGIEMLYETVGDFDDYEPYEWESDERWDPNETQNIQILRDYNEFMRSHSWAQKAPTVRKLLSKPYTGGRVYTPYQNIVNRRVQIRSKTLLSGHPLMECDFSANHPYMLARLTGNDFHPNFYQSIADVSHRDRSEVKAVLTAAIGCSSVKKKHQVRYELTKKRISTDNVDSVISAAIATYPWLEDHNILFANKGVYMQWLEGEIAMKMFTYAVQEGIPMVNIHDAYAVNVAHEAKVKRRMHIAREEVLEAYKSIYNIINSQ